MLFSRIRHRFGLSRQWAKRDRIERDYDDEIEAATKAGERDRRRELEEEQHYEVRCLDEHIAELETRFLVREARRLLIARPTFDEGTASRSEMSGLWILRPHALAELRAEIRKERAGRRAPVLSWITALTGLVGAAIVLAAVLLSGGQAHS